jgi:hypothetical protein
MSIIVISLVVSMLLGMNPLIADVGNLPEFKLVTPMSEGIKLVSWDHGVRLSYEIGDAEMKIQNYGECIIILNNVAAKFVEKHISIQFTPLVGNPGAFTIKRICDMRSMGGPRTQESFVLSIDTGKVIYSEKIVTVLDK